VIVVMLRKLRAMHIYLIEGQSEMQWNMPLNELVYIHDFN